MSNDAQNKTPSNMPQVVKNRFVIAKKMIGQDLTITFKNHKGEEVTYEHDSIFDLFKAKFEAMPCFNKYGNYTNSNNLPKFVREAIK